MPSPRFRVPVLTPSRRRVLIVLSAVIASTLWALIVLMAEPYDWGRIGTGHDARPYWTAVLEAPYATSRVGAHDAYLYSPAFLQAIAPLRALAWQGFMAGWIIVLMGAVLYLVGPVLLGGVLLLTVLELIGGNITLLLAAAIVLGFRWPAAWAFVVLTKVTPGIGLLWFVTRGEWRNLGIAAAATAAVVAVSFVTAPTGVWPEWIAVLTGNATAPITSGSLPDTAPGPAAGRGARDRLGGAGRPAVGAADRLPAGTAGDLVRQPLVARGDDPAPSDAAPPGVAVAADHRQRPGAACWRACAPRLVEGSPGAGSLTGPLPSPRASAGPGRCRVRRRRGRRPSRRDPGWT